MGFPIDIDWAINLKVCINSTTYLHLQPEFEFSRQSNFHSLENESWEEFYQKYFETSLKYSRAMMTNMQ